MLRHNGVAAATVAACDCKSGFRNDKTRGVEVQFASAGDDYK